LQVEFSVLQQTNKLTGTNLILIQ
jgi:hypothetical protein